ncbi:MULTISPECIES: SMI1/KNR4 family protein [Rodentibacter]|nr:MULTISPECIES: SMI1/KNR4 family protein [Pasteurellaceae]MCQ9122458.1 SMI1/KNR4 family protein [Rodentibacter heylii]MCX2962180.1 SMI1/KNR4 family protein [Rodentibacter heylii]
MSLIFKKLGLSPEDLEDMQKNSLRLDKRDKRALIKTYETDYVITQDDIVALEAEIGFSLPQDYIDFLMRYNGGDPSKSVFNENVVVQYFFALKSHYSGYLLINMGDYGLAIAETPNGDQLVLSPTGKIYYFDHEIPYCEGEELEFVCESFTALLEGLY